MIIYRELSIGFILLGLGAPAALWLLTDIDAGHLSFISILWVVLMLLLSFCSSSHEQLKNYPVRALLLAALGSIIMHLILLAGMWYGGRLLRYSSYDCKALIFTGASKTLTLALTTLAIMNAGSGEAVVPCMIFYFLQMLIDSSIAGKMGLAAKNQTESAEPADSKPA